MMRNVLFTTTALLSLSLAIPALAQQAPNPDAKQQSGQSQLSQPDQQFVQQAGIGNQFEIQAGQIAKDKASNKDVQKFAQRMIEDHTKVGDHLTKIVQPLNAQVPQQLDDQHRNKLDTLRGLSGTGFDSHYIQGQIDAHNQTITLFETESKSGQNQDLKKFASDTLPTLRDHLKSAQDLSKQIPAASAANANGQPAGSRLMGQQTGSLIGTNAVTADNKDIGEIQNILVNPNGQVEAVIVEWGGFLGLGQKEAAVPWNRVNLNKSGDRIVIDMTRQEMAALPEYNGKPSSVAGIDSKARAVQ
jgi:putative membrane protein